MNASVTTYPLKKTFIHVSKELLALYPSYQQREERTEYIESLKKAAHEAIHNAGAGFYLYYLKFTFDDEAYCLSSYVKRNAHELILYVEAIGNQSSDIVITERQHAKSVEFFTKKREKEEAQKKNSRKKRTSYLHEEDKNLTSVPYAEIHA